MIGVIIMVGVIKNKEETNRLNLANREKHNGHVIFSTVSHKMKNVRM